MFFLLALALLGGPSLPARAGPQPAQAGALQPRPDAAAALAAIRQQDREALRRALAGGLDPDHRVAHGKTLLMMAARTGARELVRVLLDAGADPDARSATGGTALMFAALAREPDAARLLIEAGAEVQARASFGWTALMVATVKGRRRTMELLLAAGADPNLRDRYGWTPLMRAIERGRIASVRVLLADRRTRVDTTDLHGNTALHVAAASGAYEAARLLLEAGASPTLANEEGKRPLELALQSAHPELAQLLRTRKVSAPARPGLH